jgi:carboxyl-terminal processing protease
MRTRFPSPTFRLSACAAAALLAGCGGDARERPLLLDPLPPPELAWAAEWYLNSALNLMEAESIRRNQIDWPALRQRAFDAAGPAQRPRDTHDAIRAAVAELGDGHSSFVSNPGAVNPQPRTHPSGTTLDGGRVGYLRVPWFAHEDPDSHAVEYHDLLRSLDSPAVCGWVVDLRTTAGGNMWPMLAGVGPILGNGTAGSFVDADGGRRTWAYADGDTYIGGGLYTRLPAPAYTLHRPNPPVAVLTNNVTVSSGEAIAVSFRGRPDTRIFGTPTRGLSSGNRGFVLSDGAFLILTATYMADRDGTSYGGGKLPPDVTVDAPFNDDPEKDAVVAAGRAWLAAHPACAP